MRQSSNNINNSKPVIEIRQKLVQPVAEERLKVSKKKIVEDREVVVNSDDQDQFMIPRPRLIVPVHTYARKRRTGNLRADVGGDEDNNTGADLEEGKLLGK